MSKTYRNQREDSISDNNLVDPFKVPKSKIMDKMEQIINHFNLGSNLAIHLKDCLIERDTQFDDTFSLKFQSTKIKKGFTESTLKLKSIQFPYKLHIGGQKSIDQSDCVIGFDSNQNVTWISFEIIFHVKGNNNHKCTVNMTFDKNFNLVKYICNDWIYNIRTKKIEDNKISKNKTTLCPPEDEVFLLNMKFNEENELIKETLPEGYVRSAYDFSSDDFKSRLELIDMILF